MLPKNHVQWSVALLSPALRAWLVWCGAHTEAKSVGPVALVEHCECWPGRDMHTEAKSAAKLEANGAWVPCSLAAGGAERG